MTITQEKEFGRAYAHSQIDRQRNPFRKLIKSFYVTRVVHHVDDKGIINYLSDTTYYVH